jgi:hypothetical protein
MYIENLESPALDGNGHWITNGKKTWLKILNGVAWLLMNGMWFFTLKKNLML